MNGSTPANTNLTKLRAKARKVIEREGLSAAARRLAVSQGVLARAGAGGELRQGSIVLLTFALQNEP